MEIFENKIEINFSNSTNAHKAKTIAINTIASFPNKDTWGRNTEAKAISRLVVEGNTLKHLYDEYSGFTTDDLLEVMTVVIKSIAEQLPSENFSFDVFGEDTYTEGELEGQYENGTLEMKSTYWPMGYVETLDCPECGEEIVTLDEFDPSKTYYCPECGEEIDLTAEYEDVKPIVECSFIRIA